MTTDWTLIDATVAVVPLVIIFFSVIIGSKQAREFHDHTGDTSLLAHVAALSTFRNNVAAGAPSPTPSEQARPARSKRRIVEHAEAA